MLSSPGWPLDDLRTARLVCLPSTRLLSARQSPVRNDARRRPLVNVGGGPNDAQFFSLDFAQKILAQQNKKPNQRGLARVKELVDSGSLSELDLPAPANAINEFNKASSLLRVSVPRRQSSTCEKRFRHIPGSSQSTITSAWHILTQTPPLAPRPNSKPPLLWIPSFLARS